jgi:hypothetical protein
VEQHQDSHVAFVARDSEHAIVGMAWVALVSRVPRPSETGRLSADIQTVFVLPDHRQAHRSCCPPASTTRPSPDHSSTQMINASYTGAVIRIDPIGHYLAATRPSLGTAT